MLPVGTPTQIGLEFDVYYRMMNAHREGWVGEEYVRLYAATARQAIASLYEFHEFLSGYEIYGSWGSNALCLAPDSKLYRIPWIPLSEAHRQEAYPSLEALHSALAKLNEATPAYEHFRKEIHFTTPIVFGGRPNDTANITMVNEETHAQLCVYWNVSTLDLLHPAVSYELSEGALKGDNSPGK